MDIGVWMSQGALAHKRDTQFATQTWNLREIPEGFGQVATIYRLFVAVEGYWRGFFVLKKVACNIHDRVPWTVAFDPHTWTAVVVSPAPRRDRYHGYTREVPSLSPHQE